MTQSTKYRNVYYYTPADIAAMSDHAREFSGITTEGWYFWDETESGAYGPYPDEDTTNVKLEAYAKALNAENEPCRNVE